MQSYAPHLSTGQLTKEQQNRFFDCVWGVLDLIVVKRMIVHDDSRDHFTREDIFRLFNDYFEYDKKTALQFTNFIFVGKKILVGGSIAQLKDQELALIFRLIDDYRNSYYIIHKQLPLLRNASKPQHKLSKEQIALILKKFKRSFKTLKTAYQRENVIYTIQDLNRYGEYLNTNKEKTHHLFSLFQGLFEGVLFPQTKIQDQNWDTAFKMLYKSLNLFLYYTAHFKDSLHDMEKRYIHLESANLFLDMISENPNQGFPVKSLDKMFLSAIGLLEGQSLSLDRFLSKLKNKTHLALITRSILCFSLKHPKGCNVNRQASQIQVSFPDVEFTLSDGQFVKKDSDTKSILFLTSAQIQNMQKWLNDYQEGIQHIYYDLITETALKYQFDQWLDPFFGWNKDGIIFGAFDSTTSAEKSFWLLENQVFLSFFLESHTPKGFFSSTEQTISLKTWKQIFSDFSPMLSVLLDIPAHDSSIKQQANALFSLADQFLNSSDRNQSLNSKELLDLSVHLFSALKQSDRAFNEISKHCSKNNIKKCRVQTFFEEQKLLSAYPRFKEYIFKETQPTYYKKISLVLDSINENHFSSMDLLPLFFLIQVMETNYHLLDSNQSFNLEAHELLSFAHAFKNEVYANIPYIYSKKQAMSYIMYSFKTGVIPFFTGSDEAPIQFSHWHFHPESRKPFTITANEFHFLIFDLYNLYKQF